MNMVDQIQIVGTNHISKQSLNIIKSKFLEFKPDIICIELDKQRYLSLLSGDQKLSFRVIKILGVKGFIFVLISRFFQQKMGKMTGMKPGSEMLYATQLAKNNNLGLSLIDQRIDITIKRLMKKITFKEKKRFLHDITIGLIPFKKKQKIKINISKIPQEKIINKLIGELSKRYPSVHKVLIDERNHFMAKKLTIIHKKNPTKKLLVVVGAGHKEEMLKLLLVYNKKIEII